MNIDPKHKEILEILSRDSRLTAEKIAPMVDMPVAEVESAIAELEEQGIIKRYNVTIDWEKAGIERIVAFIDVKVVPAREVGFEAVLQLHRHNLAAEPNGAH